MQGAPRHGSADRWQQTQLIVQVALGITTETPRTLSLLEADETYSFAVEDTHSGLVSWLGFLILQFPVQCFRLLSWGRYPTPKQLRREKFVGYMALGFGILFLLELAFGIIR
jgi:hypothetical protein